MLRTVHALNVTRLAEIVHRLVGQTQAIVLRTRRVFYVANDPVVVTGQLEGRHTLALLLALEVDVVVVRRFGPGAGECGGSRREESRRASLLLDHHVPLAVGLHPVDVGVDGGVAPVKEQPRLRQLRERLVGIRVVHPVVLLFGTVPHRVVHEVASPPAVGPHVVVIPYRLGSPYAVDGLPVLIDALHLRVTEDAGTLSEVEGHALPVQQVIAAQQVYAVVVPLGLLLQPLEGTHVHIGTEHQIARAVVLAEDVGITCSPLDAGMFAVAEYGVAVQQVVVVHAVSTQGIGRPGTSPVVHVTVQIAVVTLLEVPFLLLRRHRRRHHQQHRNHCCYP